MPQCKEIGTMKHLKLARTAGERLCSRTVSSVRIPQDTPKAILLTLPLVPSLLCKPVCLQKVTLNFAISCAILKAKQCQGISHVAVYCQVLLKSVALQESER